MWLIVIALDLALDFRLEFLWPCWMFLKRIFESFKYKNCVCFYKPIFALGASSFLNQNYFNVTHLANKWFLCVNVISQTLKYLSLWCASHNIFSFRCKRLFWWDVHFVQTILFMPLFPLHGYFLSPVHMFGRSSYLLQVRSLTL